MSDNTFSANGHKRAALYARVSTVGQLDNTSPDTQLERCRAYTQERDYSIVKDNVIEAIGGTFVFARSKFNELLDMGHDGKLDVIICDIPDRLGRGEAIGQLRLLAKMNGVAIEFATPGRNTDTVEGLALDLTDQLVSGIERQNIRRRTMGGRRNHASAGRVIASNFKVYGYDIVSEYDDKGHKVSCRMILKNNEAEIVRQIFAWFVLDGLTPYAIAHRLTENKTPKPTGGQGWARSTIRGILRNPTYKGTWFYSKREVYRDDTPDGIKTQSRKRAHDEAIAPIAVGVPIIVSQAVWKAAQDRSTANKRRGHKPTKNFYLLRGKIRCARCNSLLLGQTKAKANKDGTHKRYYRCRKNFTDITHDRCAAKQLDLPTAEKAVWDTIREMLLDHSRLLEGIEADRAEAEKARRMIQTTITGIDNQIEKAQGKIDRLLDLYTGGDLDKQAYLSKRGAIQGEIDHKQNERLELQEKLSGYKVLTQDQQAELETFIGEIVAGVDNATDEDKAEYMEWLKVTCLYDDRTGDLTVSGILGGKTLNVSS